MSSPTAPATGELPSARRDPLARVFELGRRELPVGVAIGLVGALVVHGGAFVHAAQSLIQMGDFAEAVASFVVERQRASIDIDKIEIPPELEKPPETKPAETEPEPVARTAEKAAPEAAPAAAEAGKVMTQEPNADDPLDLTGDSFVTGSSDRYAGGTTAASGTSKVAVDDPRAKGGEGPKGNGTAPRGGPAPAPTGKDQSRPSTPTSRSWNCGFPAEADFDQVDFATVMITVTVGTDGRAKSVSVLSDPGHGFGKQARSCAMRMSYTPGLDRNGQPVVKTTSPFPVRFTR